MPRTAVTVPSSADRRTALPRTAVRCGLALGAGVRLGAVLGAAAGAILASCSPAAGQIPSPSSPPPIPSLADLDRVPTGEVLERVVSDLDSARSYALYVPSGYDPARAWPALLVMDPRGRAVPALDRFLGPAERLGYLVLSSYDTRSDDPEAPNEAAVEAMLADVQRFFNIDARRFYLVGFSGTARLAWRFAVRLQGSVAGVIGVGAGLPPDYQAALEALKEYLSFAFFGGAGTTDFNFDEVRRLDQRLDGIGMTHRIAHWPGPHGWPPEEVCARAVEWLELQAVRTGLASREEAWVSELLARRREEAAALAEAGRLRDAALAYRAIAEDFAGSDKVAGDAARAEKLAATAEARRRVEVEEELTARREEHETRIARFFRRLEAEGPVPLSRAREELRLAELERQAGADPDAGAGTEAALRRDAARRLLETIFVHASFYEPRRHLEEGDAERALSALEVAAEIEPRHPRVCGMRARAHAALGRAAEAVEALECLADAGRADPDRLAASPHLAAIRDHPAFRAFLERLRRAGGDDSGRRVPR